MSFRSPVVVVMVVVVPMMAMMAVVPMMTMAAPVDLLDVGAFMRCSLDCLRHARGGGSLGRRCHERAGKHQRGGRE